jgi:hypothetical protein
MFETDDVYVCDMGRALAAMVRRYRELPADVRAFVAADADLPD